MNIVTIILLSCLSLNVLSHTIKGTMVLKGPLKTRVFIKNKETSCRIKIEKVKNLLEEDSFGNPAYKVRAQVGLDSINFEKDIWLNNLFSLGKDRSEVRDFEYHSEDNSIKMKIDDTGRIKTVLVRYKNTDISCFF
jgi:hypothetical protein